SRRLHTRSTRDWSSDVCSSDIGKRRAWFFFLSVFSCCGLLMCLSAEGGHSSEEGFRRSLRIGAVKHSVRGSRQRLENDGVGLDRSEERRVGKESGESWGGVDRR